MLRDAVLSGLLVEVLALLRMFIRRCLLPAIEGVDSAGICITMSGWDRRRWKCAMTPSDLCLCLLSMAQALFEHCAAATQAAGATFQPAWTANVQPAISKTQLGLGLQSCILVAGLCPAPPPSSANGAGTQSPTHCCKDGV